MQRFPAREADLEPSPVQNESAQTQHSASSLASCLRSKKLMLSSVTAGLSVVDTFDGSSHSNFSSASSIHCLRSGGVFCTPSCMTKVSMQTHFLAVMEMCANFPANLAEARHISLSGSEIA